MATLKLSEAIRLGAMALPPIKGPYFERDADGRICGACVLGAAMYAVNGEQAPSVSDYESLWPFVLRRAPVCPACGVVPHPGGDNVACRIIQLFEGHDWSREQIADWVEQIEREHDAATPTDTLALEPVTV